MGALLCDPPASVKRHSAMFYGALERVHDFVSSPGGRQMTADQLKGAHNLFGTIPGAASQAEASFKTRSQADWRAWLTKGIDQGARN
eukprot:9478832-Pyramimonas_sp.AAC.1